MTDIGVNRRLLQTAFCSDSMRFKGYLSFVLPLFHSKMVVTRCNKIFSCPWKKTKLFRPKTYPLLRAHNCVSLLGDSSLLHIYSGVGSSFSLTLFSEIGDKTFFLAALLALKYSKRIVFVGTLVALIIMTMISVLIGMLFHVFPNQLHTLPIDDYIATALLFWFGIDNIRAFLRDNEQSSNANEWQGEVYKNNYESVSAFQYGNFDFRNVALRQMLRVFSIIFTAEWGDKSMLATVALSATQPPVAVMLGKPKH